MDSILQINVDYIWFEKFFKLVLEYIYSNIKFFFISSLIFYNCYTNFNMFKISLRTIFKFGTRYIKILNNVNYIFIYLNDKFEDNTYGSNITKEYSINNYMS